MANIYVRSTDGNNADNGSTWALAKATLVGANLIAATGDTVFVSQSHAESTASAVNMGWPGTSASPFRLICANDGAEPPTAVATTATITTTGNSNIGPAGGTTTYQHLYGMTFNAGSGASGTASILLGGNTLYKNCSFWLSSTGTCVVNLSSSTSTWSTLIDCTFKLTSANHSISAGSAGRVSVSGGSILSGSTTASGLFTPSANTNLSIDGFDMSNCASTVNLVSSTSINAVATFRNCKLPASWSGDLSGSTPGAGAVFEMFNCDSGDTNYRYRKANRFGTIRDETTLVRTGGASDGTTIYSFKLVSGADAEYPLLTLDTPEIVKWNDTTGSAITATVEVLFDSATALKDDEIWVEVMYLGTSGYPLGSFISDAKADVLATAADQTSSSTTWTTTGMANPNKQKLAVTFTPQEKGFIHATVKLAKASTTVYVDPMITVT